MRAQPFGGSSAIVGRRELLARQPDNWNRFARTATVTSPCIHLDPGQNLEQMTG
jgi:hypothetical protein